MARGRAGGNSLQRPVCVGEGRGRAQQVPDDPSPGLQTGAARGQPEACSSLRSRGNAGHGPGDDEKTGRGAAKREVIALRCSLGRDQ